MRIFQNESTQYCLNIIKLLFEETNDVLASKDMAFYFYVI